MKFQVINRDMLFVYKNNIQVAKVIRLTGNCPVIERVNNIKLPIEEWHLVHDTAQQFFTEQE
jgi:hypothetical protein